MYRLAGFLVSGCFYFLSIRQCDKELYLYFIPYP
jgi:hypothetical protein